MFYTGQARQLMQAKNMAPKDILIVGYCDAECQKKFGHFPKFPSFVHWYMLHIICSRSKLGYFFYFFVIDHFEVIEERERFRGNNLRFLENFIGYYIPVIEGTSLSFRKI